MFEMDDKVEERMSIEVITEMEMVNGKLENIKKSYPHDYDGRSVSIAITHLETAMLWFANARKHQS